MFKPNHNVCNYIKFISYSPFSINESLVDNNESLDMITRGNQADLMFDVTTYKAAKEVRDYYISKSFKCQVKVGTLYHQSEDYVWAGGTYILKWKCFDNTSTV